METAEIRELRYAEDTKVQELVARMQHRLGPRPHSKRELLKFAEMFLMAAEELDEMRAEGVA